MNKKDRLSESILSNIKENTSVKKVRKSKKVIKESGAPEIVYTVNYNRLSVWKSRKEAINFYKDCAAFSEGSEKERYTILLLDLMDGADFAVDNYDDDDSVWEIDWMGSTPKSGQCAVAKEKLEGHQSAKDIVGKIKSGKIMPPKEFLDELEESKKIVESGGFGSKYFTIGLKGSPIVAVVEAESSDAAMEVFANNFDMDLNKYFAADEIDKKAYKKYSGVYDTFKESVETYSPGKNKTKDFGTEDTLSKDQYEALDYYLDYAKLYDSGFYLKQDESGNDYFIDDENGGEKLSLKDGLDVVYQSITDPKELPKNVQKGLQSLFKKYLGVDLFKDFGIK